MPLAQSLATLFAYKGQIGRFDLFAVMAAVYFDESADEKPKGRIGVAGAVANATQWISFEQQWRKVLDDAGVSPGDFHAVGNSYLQQELSEKCARLSASLKIGTLCVTVREDVYERCTTPEQRQWFGNAYCFARYCCFMSTSEAIKTKSDDTAGYYVEKGGKGFGWIMEHFGLIYRDDKLRASRRMADFGPVDRRIHLPVHQADLVAHEVLTNRHSSKPLAILGQLVTIDDVNEDDLSDLIHDWTKDQLAMNKLKEMARRRRD